MSSTVTTGKRVAAFKTPSGTIFYALFEQTYEKNVYPHTPRWCCISFGPIETVMERIFAHASSCEGGMLQARNGYVSPEGYIAGWLKALAAPGELPDFNISLKAGSGFYATISESTQDAAFAVLAARGRQDLVDALAAGQKVQVALYEHAELLAALHTEAEISTWRLLSSAWAEHYPSPRHELRYAPQSAKAFLVEVPNFRKVDADSRLVQQPDGTWRCMGREYSIIGNFIHSLWQSELREPGSYRKRIKSFREAIRSSLPIPEAAKVHIDLSVPLEHEYQRRQVDELRRKVPVRATPTGYEVAVVPDQDVIWKLTHLPAECTTWLLPEQEGCESASHADLSPQMLLLTA